MASPKFASYFGGIGRALSVRDYRVYWYSHVFSSHGVWMHRMAVGVLIFQLTGSPAWLGFIGFVYSLPLMVLGPIAGAIADRFGIRRTAIVAIILTVGLAFLMGFLTLVRLMTPELLASVVVILGVLHAFDFPIRQILIQLLVGPEKMSAAIALNSTTFNTSAFTGPMLGAGVLALGRVYFGDAAAGIVFILYGLTMAALLGAILRTNMRDKPSEGGDFAKLLRDVREGLRYTVSHPGMRISLAMWFAVSLTAKPYMDLLPGYALAVFDRGTEGVGTLMAASGIGALCFSFFMALRGRTAGLTRILIFSAAGASAAMILFSAATDFWFAAAAMALVGGAFVVANIASQSLIQNTTDGPYRARVISVYFALVTGAQAMGVLVLGWIAEYAGFPFAIGLGAAVSLGAVVVMGPALWRRAGILEAPRTEDAPSRAKAAE
jgi:MFS family permease